jgi:cytochrome c5
MTIMTSTRPFAYVFAAASFSLFVVCYKGAAVEASVSTPTPSPRGLPTLLATGFWAHALQAASGPDKAKSEDLLPDGKGKDVTKRVCSGCHSVSVFADKRHSADEWDVIINNMIAKGLDAPDDDLTSVHNYLVTYLGPAKKDPADIPPAGSSSSR